VQGGLHANEAPGILTALHVARALADTDVLGEVVVVPSANPLGLAQRLLGTPIGRYSLNDGRNFNRGYPLLIPDDASDDADATRAALVRAASSLPATTPEDHLRRALLSLAIDADIVLDLHCDGEAVPHIYALTPQADAASPLAARLGAGALLLAEVSGDDPFDEACGRPWLSLRERFPSLPLGCLAMTVELRGQADVSRALAEADSAAIVDFLRQHGIVAGDPAAPAYPPPQATPLAGMEAAPSPVAGILVHAAPLGATVEAGTLLAEVFDLATGAALPIRATIPGRLFARTQARVVAAGQRVAKVAGSTARRTGLLLTP
jgi:predicted deacylase